MRHHLPPSQRSLGRPLYLKHRPVWAVHHRAVRSVHKALELRVLVASPREASQVGAGHPVRGVCLVATGSEQDPVKADAAVLLVPAASPSAVHRRCLHVSPPSASPLPSPPLLISHWDRPAPPEQCVDVWKRLVVQHDELIHVYEPHELVGGAKPIRGQGKSSQESEGQSVEEGGWDLCARAVQGCLAAHLSTQS